MARRHINSKLPSLRLSVFACKSFTPQTLYRVRQGSFNGVETDGE